MSKSEWAEASVAQDCKTGINAAALSSREVTEVVRSSCNWFSANITLRILVCCIIRYALAGKSNIAGMSLLGKDLIVFSILANPPDGTRTCKNADC